MVVIVLTLLVFGYFEPPNDAHPVLETIWGIAYRWCLGRCFRGLVFFFAVGIRCWRFPVAAARFLVVFFVAHFLVLRTGHLNFSFIESFHFAWVGVRFLGSDNCLFERVLICLTFVAL